MSLESWLITIAIIFCVTSTTLIVTGIQMVVGIQREIKADNWRETFRALQLENRLHLKKVHDENTRFFKSIGIKAEQIFERVDDPGWRD